MTTALLFNQLTKVGVARYHGEPGQTLLSALEHLDCADDVALLSHTDTTHLGENELA